MHKYEDDADERLRVCAVVLSAMTAALELYLNGTLESPIQVSERHEKGNFIEDFLQSCFGNNVDEVAVELLDKFLILHAEHGMNCSTMAVRTVASSLASPFDAIAAGIAAFSGPLHGGASERVGRMIDEICRNKTDISLLVQEHIDHKRRLMGFGHRIYKKTDPRASYMHTLLSSKAAKFASVRSYADVALALYTEVLHRDYFSMRGIYPNPDLFNGILLRRAGFPSKMNTALLCLSRAAGWLAHYYDSVDSRAPIIRPQELHGDGA